MTTGPTIPMGTPGSPVQGGPTRVPGRTRKPSVGGPGAPPRNASPNRGRGQPRNRGLSASGNVPPTEPQVPQRLHRVLSDGADPRTRGGPRGRVVPPRGRGMPPRGRSSGGLGVAPPASLPTVPKTKASPVPKVVKPKQVPVNPVSVPSVTPPQAKVPVNPAAPVGCKFCTECGVPRVPGSKFCGECGFRF